MDWKKKSCNKRIVIGNKARKVKEIVLLSGKQRVAERGFTTELNQHDEEKNRRRDKENDEQGEKEKDSCALDNSIEILK